jgi:hypothetical protein
MKLSVVIPHHFGLRGTEDNLRRCIESLYGYDELVVLANDGIGFGPAVNKGLALSTGDHIIIANDDTWLVSGTLRDLIVNDAVTVPLIKPEPKDHLPRAFFCVPRWAYEKLLSKDGFFYDPQFDVGYWEDDDLIKRLELLGIKIKKIETLEVEHLHGGGFSMKQMGEQKFYDLNKERFEKKWANEDNN